MFVFNIVLIAFAISPAVSSDVRNPASISTCRASEFTCLDGTCISAGAVCDTYWDCPDGSDEVSCYTSINSNLTAEATVSHERYKRQLTCGSYQWQCTDGTCIAFHEICDGKTDCPDESDETHALCRNEKCEDDSFRCTYGACVDATAPCNNIIECADQSDELLPRCRNEILSKPTVSGKCVLPPYPEHGTYVETNNPSASPGQSFEYVNLNITCDQGYGVVGDAVSYCQGGKWLKPIQKCVPFCRLYRDDSIHYNCQIPGTTGYRTCNQFEPSGTIVKPECNATEYFSRDLDYMTCECNGKWNRTIKCVPDCGRVYSKMDPLISGGNRAIAGELPWHVAIYRKNGRDNFEQICGGSLVSETIVISAAHCFVERGKNGKLLASKYAVAAGKLFREWDHKDEVFAHTSELKSIEIPDHYIAGDANFQSDIAILILETPVVYYSYARPVCLDFETDFNKRQLKKGNFGKIAGWGLTDKNGNQSPVLNVVELPFVTIVDCINTMPHTFTKYITEDKICAGYNNGTAAVCRGDSGGGLSFPEVEQGKVRYYLRGVASTTPMDGLNICNTKAIPTFTEIYKHRDFINQFL